MVINMFMVINMHLDEMFPVLRLIGRFPRNTETVCCQSFHFCMCCVHLTLLNYLSLICCRQTGTIILSLVMSHKNEGGQIYLFLLPVS